jgi:PAS domain S-box-containing protein
MMHDKNNRDISLLYVEDEPVTRELVAGVLTTLGIRIHVAKNGRDGLESYRQFHHDIVVSDVLMPCMTGLEMARQIRAENEQVQIVIVSSHSDTEFLLEAIDISIKHFVLKPLDMQKLMGVVDECISFVLMQRLLDHQNDKIRMLTDAIEQNSDITMITDTSGVIEYVNKSFCQVTGYQSEDVVGRTPQLLNSGENTAALYQQLWSRITAGKVWNGELLNRKKSSELYWEDMTISPVRNKDGEIVKYIKIASDVTERKKLVEEVLNARKLESIATFAGGISHDFNNLLQIIITNLYIIQRELGSGSGLTALATDAYAASLRAKDLNIKLLEFARQEKIVREAVHLGEVVEEAAALFLRDGNVALDSTVSPQLWPVMADRTQLGQVIANLLINAGEAMPEGGIVTVRAENLVLEQANELQLQTGPHVRIVITDQGVGIPEEHLNRVFDPYFSTKTLANRKGNGLGLAICHTVVKNHGGLIRIESVENEGSTVSIYLPADRRYTAMVEMKPGRDGNLRAFMS